MRKIKLISKFIRSQPRKHTITINILSNISKSKGFEIWSFSKAMKFGHLIKENMRIIFIEKSYTKHDGQNIKDIFGLIV